MQFQIYSKNLTVTESLHEYIQTRLDQVDKVSSDVISCRVDISRDTHHKKGDVFTVEINITLPKKQLCIVEAKPDVRAAVDIATDKIKRQAKKITDKRRDRKRRVARFISKIRNNN